MFFEVLAWASFRNTSIVSPGTFTMRREPASRESVRLYDGFWLRSKLGLELENKIFLILIKGNTL